MNRNSPYFRLTSVVECQPPGQHFFEPIAAFNSDIVAVLYAMDCHKSKMDNVPSGQLSPWHYRVMERTGRRWVEIYNEVEGRL